MNTNDRPPRRRPGPATAIPWLIATVLAVALLHPAAAAQPTETFADLKQDAEGYWKIGWEHLASFTFEPQRNAADAILPPYGREAAGLVMPGSYQEPELPTEPGLCGPIPAQVRALDGRRVRISGYMLPLRTENGLVKECLLLRSPTMCCFGTRPALNEWVVVKMKGDGVASLMDVPITFYGRLHVGEMFNHDMFEGIYELVSDKLTTD